MILSASSDPINFVIIVCLFYVLSNNRVLYLRLFMLYISGFLIKGTVTTINYRNGQKSKKLLVLGKWG